MTGARVVIAAVVVALGVSACSGSDPEPKLAPPTSSTPSGPSTSPASEPVAPTMPPEAMGDDAAAAEAFVKFYWDTVNYAQETGDVEALRALSRKCRGCDAGLAFIEKVYDSDGSITGGRGHVVDLNTGFIGNRNRQAVVTCVVVSTKQTIDYPGSKKDDSYSGGRQPLRFVLNPTDTGWVAIYMGAQ